MAVALGEGCLTGAGIFGRGIQPQPIYIYIDTGIDIHLDTSPYVCIYYICVYVYLSLSLSLSISIYKVHFLALTSERTISLLYITE